MTLQRKTASFGNPDTTLFNHTFPLDNQGQTGTLAQINCRYPQCAEDMNIPQGQRTLQTVLNLDRHLRGVIAVADHLHTFGGDRNTGVFLQCKLHHRIVPVHTGHKDLSLSLCTLFDILGDDQTACHLIDRLENIERRSRRVKSLDIVNTKTNHHLQFFHSLYSLSQHLHAILSCKSDNTVGKILFLRIGIDIGDQQSVQFDNVCAISHQIVGVGTAAAEIIDGDLEQLLLLAGLDGTECFIAELALLGYFNHHPFQQIRILPNDLLKIILLQKIPRNGVDKYFGPSRNGLVCCDPLQHIKQGQSLNLVGTSQILRDPQNRQGRNHRLCVRTHQRLIGDDDSAPGGNNRLKSIPKPIVIQDIDDAGLFLFVLFDKSFLHYDSAETSFSLCFLLCRLALEQGIDLLLHQGLLPNLHDPGSHVQFHRILFVPEGETVLDRQFQLFLKLLQWRLIRLFGLNCNDKLVASHMSGNFLLLHHS